MSKPIDDLTAIFFRMLHEACNGQCVIAGGAALAHYLLPQKLFDNEYIDIFVPSLPQAIHEYTCSAVKIHPNSPGRGATIQSIINNVVRMLRQSCQIDVENTTTFAILPTHTINLQHTNYFTAQVRDIHSYAKFCLVRGNNRSKPIRIIALQGYPTMKKSLYSNNLWGEHVMSYFELDIEQVFLTPTVYATRSNKFDVSLTRTSANAISRREAQMNVAPCRRYVHLLQRLQKYQTQHFNINSIQFHREKSKVWTAHLIRRIIAHDPKLITAIDIVRIPHVHRESVPTHRRKPNLKHFLRRPRKERLYLERAFNNLMEEKVKTNAKKSLDYLWKW
jgi:hypothetical protein